MKHLFSHSEMTNTQYNECIREQISHKFLEKVKCNIPGLRDVLTVKHSIPECADAQSADDTFFSYIEVSYDFLKNKIATHCQPPCKRKSYKTSAKQYHKNSWNDFSNQSTEEDLFYLQMAFSSLNVESEVQTLVYDTGNMLAAAGGYLGLFLGFSCLTCLTSCIDIFAHYICKFKPN